MFAATFSTRIYCSGVATGGFCFTDPLPFFGFAGLIAFLGRGDSSWRIPFVMACSFRSRWPSSYLLIHGENDNRFRSFLYSTRTPPDDDQDFRAPKRTGAPNQGRSLNPREGAYRTALGRRPLRGAAASTVSVHQEPCGSGSRL